MSPDAEHAKATIARGCDEAREAIANAETGRQAFRLATDFADLMRAATSAFAKLRGPAARRIQQEEALNLTHLAKVIEVSRPRASQLVEGIEVDAGE